MGEISLEPMPTRIPISRMVASYLVNGRRTPRVVEWQELLRQHFLTVRNTLLAEIKSNDIRGERRGRLRRELAVSCDRLGVLLAGRLEATLGRTIAAVLPARCWYNQFGSASGVSGTCVIVNLILDLATMERRSIRRWSP